MDTSIKAEQDSSYNQPLPFETGHTIKIPVINEQLAIEKQIIETGKVTISKIVHQDNVHLDTQLFHEQVNVERIEINQYIETLPEAIRYEGETMIVSVLKEVFEKRLILVEELHVTKLKNVETVPQQENLRREEIRIERLDNEKE